MKRKLFLTVLVIFFSTQMLFALTGREIMEKTDRLPEPKSLKSSVLMYIYRNGELNEKKEFKVLARKVNGNERTLIKFVRPTQIMFLTHSYKNRDDNQWLKLRPGSKVKKIPAANRDKTFVNSHIFYEDLISWEIDDYNYKYLGDARTAGFDCYRVKAVKRKGKKVYSKTILYVRKSDYFVVRSDFYKRGKRLKYMVNKDIRVVKAPGERRGIITPFRSVMYYKGKVIGKTVLKFKLIKYNTGIRSSLLTRRAMGK